MPTFDFLSFFSHFGLAWTGTYQGYSDDSTWSRGQAWAVHGFVMLYRYTQEPRFIDYAVGLLEYFVDNLPEDNVPYSDFDAPLDDENLKDSSSTAIVASALLEMFVTIGEFLGILRMR